MDTPSHARVGAVALRSGRERHVARRPISDERHADGPGGHVWSRRSGRMASGGGAIEPDPALSHAANFLYMLTGKRPSQLEARGARRRARAARRPRVQRVHVRGAGGGRDADRRAFGRHRGDRRAEGSAARRRERRRHASAARDRAGRDRSEGRRDHPRKLARKEKIPGFGHRVYRTEDPRATHLRKMSRRARHSGRATGAGSRCRSGSSRS